MDHAPQQCENQDTVRPPQRGTERRVCMRTRHHRAARVLHLAHRGRRYHSVTTVNDPESLERREEGASRAKTELPFASACQGNDSQGVRGNPQGTLRGAPEGRPELIHVAAGAPARVDTARGVRHVDVALADRRRWR